MDMPCKFAAMALLIVTLLLAVFTVCSDPYFWGPVGPTDDHFPDRQSNPNITYGSFTDNRDGQVYRTVRIGTQTWMAENLNWAGDNGNLGWCYDNYSSHCNTYVVFMIGLLSWGLTLVVIAVVAARVKFNLSIVVFVLLVGMSRVMLSGRL